MTIAPWSGMPRLRDVTADAQTPTAKSAATATAKPSVAGDRAQPEGDRNRDQRPEGPRRERREPAAEAERDEMRRMAQQEAQRRRGAHAGTAAKWSNARGSVASGVPVLVAGPQLARRR